MIGYIWINSSSNGFIKSFELKSELQYNVTASRTKLIKLYHCLLTTHSSLNYKPHLTIYENI